MAGAVKFAGGFQPGTDSPAISYWVEERTAGYCGHPGAVAAWVLGREARGMIGGGALAECNRQKTGPIAASRQARGISRRPLCALPQFNDRGYGGRKVLCTKVPARSDATWLAYTGGAVASVIHDDKVGTDRFR